MAAPSDPVADPIPAPDPSPVDPVAPALPASISLDKAYAFFLDGAFIERAAGDTIIDPKEIAYFVGRLI